MAEPDAGARGSLTIADRALTAITRQVALEVPGVASEEHAGAVERTLGRGFPRVFWHRAGDHAAVEVEIALEWPASAARVTTAVQDAVARELARQAGQKVGRVDVRVRDVVRNAAARPRARVR
ncbi:Asp23/Gls24 family envelope stress response protein [Cellulomonas sp. H30R-01]|uniref:Asp23/Gls24 family envelope stress response protein n=1 Tax=Cellulomonas sp. H30R-01 TaxID=2704467 RepID=UPI00138CADEA|nr:Asp23/Gls24 family envelope stress response protein [Cellulomonas sp. H30R-01]QHT54738.1 Asp23/Gls24 family envelope stress response protein [Cellulomonas sp. H30R-01]